MDVNRNSTFYFVELPTRTTTPILYGINLVVNGDAETGPCSTTTNVVLPTSWTAVPPITQISYTNNADTLSNTTPGPSNRGNCFFAGGLGNSSNMSQIINVTAYADVIDSNHTLYNFSAWLGGYAGQDDNARILLRFLNNNYQTIGTQITLGPVLATDRNYITELLFRSQSGLVPRSIRYLTVSLMTTRYHGSYCDGYADNITLIFQYI